MLRRPVDQAKLLFLYFLKSSAAFASEPTKTGILKASQQQAQNIVPASLQRMELESMGGYISLRIARRADIPSIQRCNLATLPENYNESFYVNHLRNWPELALVAEHIPEGYTKKSPEKEGERKKESGGRSILSSIAGGSSRVKISPLSVAAGNQQCQIIGYVLGKVVQTPRSVKAAPFTRSRVQDDDEGFLPPSSKEFLHNLKPYEQLGHVTSLAIMDGYRRKGVAANLMNQLHYEMQQCYEADAVGLHVRVLNEAATNLYINSMGYRVDDVIPGYYQDGEDAYLMRKDFENSEELKPNSLEKELEDIDDALDAIAKTASKRKFRFPTFTSNQYRTKKEFILPRTIFEYKQNNVVDTTAKEVKSKACGSEEDKVSVVSASASLQ